MPQKQKPLAPASANGSKQKQNDQADYSKKLAIVPVNVIQDRKLTLHQLKVLLALLSFRKAKTGSCWLKRERLVECTGLHEDNISKATTGLVKLGYIARQRRRGWTEYRFLFALHDWQPDRELADSASRELADSASLQARELADSARPKQHNKKTDHTNRVRGARLKPEDLPATLPPHWREALRPQRLSDEDEVYADFRDHAIHKGEVLNNAVKALLGFAGHKQNGSAMDAVIIEKTRHWL